MSFRTRGLLALAVLANSAAILLFLYMSIVTQRLVLDEAISRSAQLDREGVFDQKAVSSSRVLLESSVRGNNSHRIVIAEYLSRPAAGAQLGSCIFGLGITCLDLGILLYLYFVLKP